MTHLRQDSGGQADKPGDFERVVRAISDGIGYNYDDLYASKAEWINDRGARGDVNMPRKPDMDEAARAALEAMMEPSREMLLAWKRADCDHSDEGDWLEYEGADVARMWQAVFRHILETRQAKEPAG